jgi:ribosomal protein L9
MGGGMGGGHGGRPMTSAQNSNQNIKDKEEELKQERQHNKRLTIEAKKLKEEINKNAVLLSSTSSETFGNVQGEINFKSNRSSRNQLQRSRGGKSNRIGWFQCYS